MGSLTFGLGSRAAYLTGEDFLTSLTSDPTTLLISLGVVFAVLILIIQLIYAFKVLPKAQGASARGKEQNTAIDNVINQIANQEEQELIDDQELVAVIMAAIYASMGTEAPADGLIVRSIRKVNVRR